MTYQILPDDFQKETFNRKATHPLQSWQWGEARKATGQTVLRIGEFDGDDLTNVFTITLHKIPKTSYRIGYCARSVMPSQELLNYLKELGKKENLIMIKFEPNVLKKDWKLEIGNSNLQKSSTPLFPTWTQLLDLTETEEELMKNLKSKTRYNVRYAERNGVTVREVTGDEGFDSFAKLYFQTVERQTYHGHNKEYHKTVWNHLKDEIAHIIIAEYEGEPLAAYELFYFNNVLYYPYGGSSDKHRNLFASNLIMWEAIRFGKSIGATSFDMWGSLPPDYDKSKEWAGFTRFKEGYGTEFVEFVGSYDLVINPLLYPIYTTAYKVRDLLLRARIL